MPTSLHEHDLEPLSDDELSALALAADPEVEVDPEAISLWDLAAPDESPCLPQWYMPAPVGGAVQVRDWRRKVIPVVIAAFVIINAYGLCSTYGQVTFG